MSFLYFKTVFLNNSLCLLAFFPFSLYTIEKERELSHNEGGKIYGFYK